jgi:hypothetical protein
MKLDITIDKTTGRFVISPQGDFVLTSGTDAVVQYIGQVLKTFLEEWFLDQTIGIPYYQELLKKNPDQTTMESAIKAAILACPGMLELTSFSLTTDTPHRALNVSFTGTCEAGEIVFNDSIGV